MSASQFSGNPPVLYQFLTAREYVAAVFEFWERELEHLYRQGAKYGDVLRWVNLLIQAMPQGRPYYRAIVKFLMQEGGFPEAPPPSEDLDVMVLDWDGSAWGL